MGSGVETTTARNLAAAIEVKDPFAKGHARSVSRAAVTLAKELGYSEDRISSVEQAGLLHDIGTIDIDRRVLLKRGRLSREEFEQIRLHPVIGANMVRPVPSLSHIAPFIETHHERWDGTGYPKGSSGRDIPEEGRILAVAETFDAMVSKRAHRGSFSPSRAITGLKTAARSQLDPQFVEAFLSGISRVAPLEQYEESEERFSLEDLIHEEKEKIQTTFVTLGETVWWMFDRLLGDRMTHRAEFDVNEFLKRHKLAVRFQGGKIREAIPHHVLPEELADIYRVAFAREISAFEKLVGKDVPRQYTRAAMESLTESGRQVCREYRLCETIN